MAMATKVYEEAAKQSQTEQTDAKSEETDKKDDVIDAEYEEK